MTAMSKTGLADALKNAWGGNFAAENRGSMKPGDVPEKYKGRKQLSAGAVSSILSGVAPVSRPTGRLNDQKLKETN